VRDRFGAGRVTAGNGSGARSPAMLSAYPATVDPWGAVSLTPTKHHGYVCLIAARPCGRISRTAT
jgi:hypothetical protein